MKFPSLLFNCLSRLFGKTISGIDGNEEKRVYLQKFDSGRCHLCGETGKLTGEHKIKRSSLRGEFGDIELYVGQIGDETNRGKFAQSTRSKHLKFQSPICESCNSHRTQPADQEYDRFNNVVLEKLRAEEELSDVFELPEYHEGSKAYLNVFRYFAKILCCHLAEIQAPSLIRLSDFAIGRSDENCVFLKIQQDVTYAGLSSQIKELQYAAHSGMTVLGDKITFKAKGFHSTLTIGPVQYVYWINLTDAEKTELETLYPEFSEHCRLQIEKARESPMDAGELLRRGFTE